MFNSANRFDFTGRDFFLNPNLTLFESDPGPGLPYGTLPNAIKFGIDPYRRAGILSTDFLLNREGNEAFVGDQGAVFTNTLNAYNGSVFNNLNPFGTYLSGIVHVYRKTTGTPIFAPAYPLLDSGIGNVWQHVQTITGIKGNTNWSSNIIEPNFGSSMAINSGNKLIISAPNQYLFANGLGVGQVYLYEKEFERWIYKQEFSGGIGNSARFGTSTDMSRNGNVFIVGEQGFEVNNIYSGSIFIFTGISGYSLARRITNIDPNDSFFGTFIGINDSGNLLATSTTPNILGGTPTNPSGKIFIFTGSGVNWTQIARVTGVGWRGDTNVSPKIKINSIGNLIAAYSTSLTNYNAGTGFTRVYILTGNFASGSWRINQQIDLTPFVATNIDLNSSGNLLGISFSPSAAKTDINTSYPNLGGKPGWIRIYSGLGPDRTFTSFYDLETPHPSTGSTVWPFAFPSSNPFGQNLNFNDSGNKLMVGPLPLAVYETVLGQSINFPNIPIRFCGDIFDPGATASSNLQVTYTSDNLSVAVPVSGNTRISLINTGIAIISGFQTGDFQYSAALPVSKTVTGFKGDQIINFNSISKKYNIPPFILTGQASTNLPLVYYISGNSSVASISNDNVVTIFNTGLTSIVAVQSGNFCYNLARSIQSLNVEKGDQSIFFNAIPIKYTNSSPFALNVFSNVGLPITISGDYVPIADISVSPNFLVTLSGFTGEAQITAIQTGNQLFSAASPVSRNLKVIQADQGGSEFFQNCICDSIDISAGAYHNTTLFKNYKVSGWGNNDYLQKDFPNQIRYVYNISAGNNYSKAIMRTNIKTGIRSDYLQFPDGYGLFESADQRGRSNLVGGTFSFPWISTGTAVNPILGYKDPLTGTCLHPITVDGVLNFKHKDIGILPYNTMIQNLTPLSNLTKPAINIIKVNNLPPGLVITGKLGPINDNSIVFLPKASVNKVEIFGLTGFYGPLYKEYFKVRSIKLINNSSGFFATGKNNFNQSETFNITGIKSAIAGKDCSFVIYNNGRITGWGESLYGENLSNISNLFRNVKDIANQGNHTIVLFENDKVSGFGSNIYGESTQLENLTGVSGISVGFTHSLAILYNGKITGWGNNFSQQTSGTSIFYSSWDQTPVGIITGAVKISAGAYHNLICLNNGRITGYGDNTYNKITEGLNLTGVIDVAAGENHSLALLNNGRITGWGYNFFGQVSGVLFPVANWESTPVGILSGVKAISTSFNHNLALLNNGKVTGWGLNTDKQYFDIHINQYLSGVDKISAGKNHSLFCIKNALAETFENTNIPLNITGNFTGFGITGSGLVITGYNTQTVIFINKPAGLNSSYVQQSNSITGVPILPGNYNTYFLIDEIGADEVRYSERYMTFSILETGRFPTIFKVCGGTIGLIDQLLS